MRVAHVRERHAPAGAPWRLARGGGERRHWLDLEIVRRRLLAADPRRAHNSILFRQPISTLDELLARGLRLEALGELLEGFVDGRGRTRADDDACSWSPTWPSGRRCSGRRRSATSTRSSSTSRRCGAARGERDPRGVVPPADLLLLERLRAPRAGRPGLGAAGQRGARFRARGRRDRRHPGVQPARGAAAEAIGGYLIVNDWSARDLQRDESTVRLGPAKGKDFAT